MDFISPVLKLVGSQLIAEYARIHGISDELKSWGEKLPGIQAILDSAEEKQMYDDDPAISLWLADLRDVAYDMEDLLDHFSVEAKREAPKLQALSRSSKLPHCLIACYSRFHPCTLISRHYMANEINDIDRRLEQVVARIPILGLVQNSRREPRNDQPRFVTTSLPEPKFVGREKQMEELLARLTRSEATQASVQPFTVVSIVGMGGLGKTTLAQELYNHESLKNADFVVKAWVCVSDVYDMAAITKSILDQVAPSSSSAEKDLNQLQSSLREKLSGKKFLLVLDDVWNNKYEELESLLKPLYSGSKGSRILLTTRNFEVARMAGDRDPKQLELMSLEESLSLLAYHSIGEKNFEGHSHLQEISVQLAKKCKGLPLSIKAIGSMLRFKTDDEQWKQVLKHGSWDREGGKIPPALKLSYVHLPIHLKRCFAACALFPKDYIFDQDELIRLWIIQGLLQKGTAKTYQEVGMENLRRLEAASFLQKASDKKTSYSMHDLINDLAKSIDACSYFSSDESNGGSTLHEDKVRHAAMVTKGYESFLSKRFNEFHSMKKLRTFMPFQISEYSEPIVYVSEDVIQDLITDMKSLRMLSLRYFCISRVPDRIGELKLLRSIDFSHTDIKILPESICDLLEMQSLLLRGCRWLWKLPRNIHKLVNLLHLDITGTNNLQEMPPLIGELTNLEILSDFVVGKEVGQELKQLGPLGCLQRELHVRNLQYVHDVEDAKVANIFGKEAIIELSLDWGSSNQISPEGDHQFNLLHHLQPPKKIESLDVNRYEAKRFPSWFNNQGCMQNVLSIILTGCRNVNSLPPFGQLPLLESLKMSGLEGISSIGPEFYGSKGPFFQSLKKLSFGNMGAWEKWLYNGGDVNGQPFPCLRELIVMNCPKLKGGCALSLPSLVEVNVDGCGGGLFTCLGGLTSMTKVNIKKIPELDHFEGSLATSWVALEEMKIINCPQFKSFVKGDGGQQVPPNLKVLEIEYCGELEKLADDLCGLTSLSKISVVYCEKLCSFPSRGLPSSLRILNLWGCPILPRSQLISMRLSNFLEELLLWDLEGLLSITDLVGVGSPLSRSLRRLEISHCGSLTTLTDSLQHLSALSALIFHALPALEMEIFPSLPCNLSSFELVGCPKVKSLPHDMHHLTSLKLLWIRDCQGLTSLSLSGGLPPNLDSLSIEKCGNLNQRIEEWGLRGLTTLRQLCIWGEMECVDEMVCFPPCGNDDVGWSCLLPSSLLRLTIKGMKKLKRVGGGLRHHLTSLQSLEISECERLKCLPDDGLPDSLEYLSIWGCTKELRKKCRKGKGEYWHSHIRLISYVDMKEDVV